VLVAVPLLASERRENQCNSCSLANINDRAKAHAIATNLTSPLAITPEEVVAKSAHQCNTSVLQVRTNNANCNMRIKSIFPRCLSDSIKADELFGRALVYVPFRRKAIEF